MYDTMETKIGDDVSALVRSALARSKLKSSPSRLEMRMLCQDVVASIQNYFSKIESDLPAALSFEGAAAASASETLSQRIAGLTSGHKSPSRLSSPRPGQEAFGGWASPSGRALPLQSPPRGESARPSPSWRFSDSSPYRSPGSIYTHTESALEGFTRKWQSHGSGLDGRPLSPTARLRQEKLRLAQRSSDLMDEKLQAFGVSPLGASKHYPHKKTAVPEFNTTSSPGGQGAHLLDRLKKIEASLKSRGTAFASPARPTSSFSYRTGALDSGSRFGSPLPGHGGSLFGSLGRGSPRPKSTPPDSLRRGQGSRPSSPSRERLQTFTSSLMRSSNGGSSQRMQSATEWLDSFSARSKAGAGPGAPTSKFSQPSYSGRSGTTAAYSLGSPSSKSSYFSARETQKRSAFCTSSFLKDKTLRSPQPKFSYGNSPRATRSPYYSKVKSPQVGGQQFSSRLDALKADLRSRRLY